MFQLREQCPFMLEHHEVLMKPNKIKIGSILISNLEENGLTKEFFIELMSIYESTNIPSEKNLIKIISEQLCALFGSSFFDPTIDIKLHINYFDYILSLKYVTIENHFLVIELGIVESTGREFRMTAEFRKIFYKIANKNAMENYKFTENSIKEPILTCKIPISQELGIAITVKDFLKCIELSMKQFEKAATLIGLSSKFNKLTYEMKRNQLSHQRNLAEIFNNKTDENLDYFNIEEKLNEVVNHDYERIEEMKKEKNEQDEDEDEDDSLRVGQTFEVKVAEVMMIKNGTEKEFKILACKKPFLKKFGSSICEEKLKREIDILSKIRNPKYTLKYYVVNDEFSSFYIDYVPQVLKNYIYGKDIFVEELIKLSNQIIDGVAILHKSGITHRDLKPENILVSRKKIKIIDFAESALKSEKFDATCLLGSTLPYSPFECRLGEEEGFNKSEIDLWSITMILYEMAFKGLPIFYNQVSKDVLENWRHGNEFTIHPIYRKRRCLLGIGGWVSLIAIRGLQVKPEERLSLVSLKKSIQVLEEFCETTKNLT